MTNEQIVDQIKNGFFVTDNLELLYTSNLPLIRLLLKPYIRIKPEDEEDLLQESYLGLTDAISHYESDKGVLFMTYAEHWIKRRARMYISTDKSIRIPNYFKEQINRYKKSVREFEQIYGHTPTDKEIADYSLMPLSEVQKIKIHMQEIVSLDAPIKADEELSLADTVADDFSLEDYTVDKIFDEYRQNSVWGIVARHTEPEQQLTLKKIYKENKTFKQIAVETGTTTDKVRNFKENGLKRLRSAKAIKELREHLEIAEASVFHSGYHSYLNHDFTSITERIAMKNIQLKDSLKRIEQKNSL